MSKHSKLSKFCNHSGRPWQLILLTFVATVFLEGKIYFLGGLLLIVATDFCVLVTLNLEYPFKGVLYPSSEMRESKTFEKMNIWVFDTNKVPKEIIYMYWTMIITLITYIVMFIFVKLLGAGSDVEAAVVIIIWLGEGTIGFLLVRHYNVECFKQRFKRLNIYNLRYRFLIWNVIIQKWPISQKYGECEIIDLKKRKRRKYATVRVTKTGQIYKKVMVCNEQINEKRQCTLHDICHVKYIY